MDEADGLFEEFRDMISELKAAGVEFLVVGGHAVAAHGVIRSTLDFDIFVRPTSANAKRVMKALRSWGAPVASHGVSAADFEHAGTVYQIGVPPRRIDILTQIDGVSFDEALEGNVTVDLGSIRFPVIGLRALIKNKRASGRHKDLGDVEALMGNEE